MFSLPHKYSVQTFIYALMAPFSVKPSGNMAGRGRVRRENVPGVNLLSQHHSFLLNFDAHRLTLVFIRGVAQRLRGVIHVWYL